MAIKLLIGKIILWYLEENLDLTLTVDNESALKNYWAMILKQKNGQKKIQLVLPKLEEISVVQSWEINIL